MDPRPVGQWGADKHQTRKNTERNSFYITYTAYREHIQSTKTSESHTAYNPVLVTHLIPKLL